MFSFALASVIFVSLNKLVREKVGFQGGFPVKPRKPISRSATE